MARDIRLGMVIEAVDRATGPLRRISSGIDRVARQTGLRRVAGALGDVNRQFGQVGREGTRALRNVTVAAAAAGGGLLLLTKRYADNAANVVDVADKLGVNVEWLQRQRYAFEQDGVAARTFDMGLQRVTRRIGEAIGGTGEAREALAWLGLQMTDTTGKARPMQDLFPEIADKLAAIDDVALRTRVAFKLFDSEGVALITTMARGSEEMALIAAEADKLGLVMGEDQVRAGKAFSDEWTRVRSALIGVRNAIGFGLLPVFEPLLVKLRNLSATAQPQIVERVTEAVQDLGEMMAWARGTIAGAVRTMTSWGKAMLTAFPALLPLVALVQEGVEHVGWFKLAVGAAAAALSSKLLVAILGLFGPLAKLGLVLATNPIILAVAAIAAAAYLIYRNWDRMPAWFKTLWSAVVEAFQVHWAILKTIWSGIAAGVGFIRKHWDTIVAVFDVVWSAVVGVVKAHWAVLTGLWSAVIATPGAIRDAWNGLVAGFAAVWAGIKAAVRAGVDGLKHVLFEIDYGAIASGIVDRFLAKLRAAWASVRAWFTDAVRGLFDSLPDWLRDRLGIGSADPPPVGPAAASAGVLAASPPLFGDRDPAAQRAQVGGRIRLEVVGADTRVRAIESDNPDVPIDVETGLALGTY